MDQASGSVAIHGWVNGHEQLPFFPSDRAPTRLKIRGSQLAAAYPMVPVSVPTVTPSAFVLGDGHTVTIAERVGAGEHATVYRAWTEDAYKLRRPVALKVFTHAPVDGDALAKLVRAIRHAALINHPNVTDVHGMGVGADGVPFVVSQLVNGCSLERLVATYQRVGRRIPSDLALFIGIEVAEGLLAARHVPTADRTVLGITHHDLSPRQVLLSWDGEVKLCDFGLRMALPAGSGIRDLQRILRSMAYLAPEVIAGERGDAKSDVFALGVMMFELLRGPRFPPGASEHEIMRFAKDGYIHTGITDAILPTDVLDVLLRAVQIDPKERYAHAGVFAYDLRKIALKMGVGDGRTFLRRALGEMSEGLYPPGETTEVGAEGALLSTSMMITAKPEVTERVSISDILLEESGELPVVDRAPKSSPQLK